MKTLCELSRVLESAPVCCRVIAAVLVVSSCGGGRNDSTGDNSTSNAVQNPSDPEVFALTQDQCTSSVINTITVSPRGQLYINAPVILNDNRAKNDPAGSWSFAFAMREILELPRNPGTDPSKLLAEEQAVDRYISMFGSTTANTVNVSARPAVEVLRTKWKTIRDSSGVQRRWLGGAPYKLVAIVNRMDLVKRQANGSVSETIAGEGRLVFGYTGGDQQTVIFEYDLPVGSASPGRRTQHDWTADWKTLKAFLVDIDSKRVGIQANQDVFTQPAFADSVRYLTHLQSITDKFVLRSAQTRTGATTQAAISQIRTNDFIQSGTKLVDWELREIIRGRDIVGEAMLQATTTKNTISALGSKPLVQSRRSDPELGLWVDQNVSCKNVADLSSCSFTTPDKSIPTLINVRNPQNPMHNKHFRPGPASVVHQQRWFSNDLDKIGRRFFALQSCDGCHLSETDVFFVHTAANDGTPSRFLTSDTMIGKFRHEADLIRRMRNFRNLVCLAKVNASEAFDLTSKTDVVAPIGQRVGVSESVH